MQSYAIKMYNFLRFGESENSLVFDLSDEQKRAIKNKTFTMDSIYDEVMKNPLKHVSDVKARGIEHILGISGSRNGDPTFSNGAGKSSILEAICYARYDRIVRRSATDHDKVEKAGLSVVTKIDGEYPKNMIESWVEELFETGGKVYRVKRGRTFSKNQKSSTPLLEFECLSNIDAEKSLSSHRTTDTKEALENIIPLDYDLFVNSQMFGQNDAGKYLTGTDKTKKEMIISLLRLQNVVFSCLEKIREKKSLSNKKVDNIKINIEIIEKYFSDKFSELSKTSACSFPTTDLISSASNPDIVLKMETCLVGLKINAEQTIENIVKLIQGIDLEIDTLSKSDVIANIEKLKEEGRKTVSEKKSKEKEMNDRVVEWLNMNSTIQKEIEKNNEHMLNLKEKYRKASELSKSLEGSILIFNLEENNTILSKCQKAKEVKPSYEVKYAEITALVLEKEKEKAVLEGNLSTSKKDLSKIEDIVAKKISGDKKYNCPECKSLVSKDHFIEKKEEYLKKIGEYENLIRINGEELKNLKIKYSDIYTKIEKINEYILKEQSILFALKKYEADKTKNKELKEQMTENNANSIRYINENSEKEKQSQKYVDKTKEIKESYDKDISKMTEKITDLMESIKEIDGKANQIKSQIEEKKTLRDSKVSEKDTILGNIGKISKEIEHFIQQKHTLNLKQKELADERINLDRILVLEEVFGLDGIQTRIVKKYLPLLNIHVKEFLDILSDGTITVKMIINEKGKVDMAIRGATADTYIMLSGGEKMIIRLAVDIGLSLLAFSRTAQKPELVCLDEILGCLDKSKSENVFRLLKSLQSKFDRILIITHKDEIKNIIPNEIRIDKGAERNALSKILWLS